MRDLKTVLTDILGGKAGGAHTILHNCRFQGAGASVYGREAIVEQFRQQPCAPEDVQLVQSGRFAALFARAVEGGVALFADLYGEYIARLRYLAAAPLTSRYPAHVDVPFDPSFGYLQTAVAFDPADHADLESRHVARVVAAAASISGAGAGLDITFTSGLTRLVRPRPFVLRAFSDGDSTAILAQVVALRSDGRPGLVQFPVAAYLRADPSAEVTVVVDVAERDAALCNEWRSVL